MLQELVLVVVVVAVVVVVVVGIVLVILRSLVSYRKLNMLVPKQTPHGVGTHAMAWGAMTGPRA